MSEEKTVKCSNEQCGMYFGYSEKSMTCPYCHTEYGKVVKKETEKKNETTGTSK